MVISNWVERQLEDRRRRKHQAFIDSLLEQGREEGRKERQEEAFEQGRAYERERIANGHTDDDEPPHSENGH